MPERTSSSTPSTKLGLFAIESKFKVDDMASRAYDDVVDGADDSGIDIVHINEDINIVVIAQTYNSNNAGRSDAKSNKVALMAQGLTRLLNEPIERIPIALKSSAESLRKLICSDKIDSIFIWYVHNALGSANVKKELITLGEQTKSLLEQLKQNNNVDIITEEIDISELDKLYSGLTVAIELTNEFKLQVPIGLEIKQDRWKAYTTAVPGTWLYEIYKKYPDKLFSSNVREYLGSKRSSKNINKSIQNTSRQDSSNFLIYNNGITALVNNFKVNKKNKLRWN